jgi:glycogen operon protein
LTGQLRWGPELFGYQLDHADKDLSYDERDSAPLVQKCRVIDPAFTWGVARKPEVPWERTIIYEMHVRGFILCRIGSNDIASSSPIQPARGIFEPL